MLYYKEEPKSLFSEFKTTEKGLSQAEANSRIEKEGYNELQVEKKINKLKLFIDQFKSFIIYILLFAVILSFITGYQEYKQELALGDPGNILFHFVDAIIILILSLIHI